MRGFLSNVPLFLPGVVLSLVLAVALGPRVAHWLSTRTLVAYLGIAGLGLVLSATLTPGVEALMTGAPSGGDCDLSRLGVIPLAELMRVSQASLNVLLFVPLGIALGLLPRTRRSVAIVALAMLLPLAIELFQAAAPALGRGCESADVIDNLTGLLLGLACGALVGAMGSPSRDRPR